MPSISAPSSSNCNNSRQYLLFKHSKTPWPTNCSNLVTLGGKKIYRIPSRINSSLLGWEGVFSSISRALWEKFHPLNDASVLWMISGKKKHCLNSSQSIKACFSILSLFWKNKSGLMRSTYCVSVCASSHPLLNALKLKQSLWNLVCTSWHLSPSRQYPTVTSSIILI
jgi:hypothetical protein